MTDWHATPDHGAGVVAPVAPSRAHRFLSVGALFSMLGVLSEHAVANGRFPAADQLVVRPAAAQSLAVRTTFGLLRSDDAGQSWDWICERAVGYSGTQDPMLGWMGDGVLVAALREGVARSTDAGCSWAFADADLEGSQVIDLAVRRDDPSAALALVWDPQAADAGAAYRARLLASDDNGVSFRAYGAEMDPTVLMLTVDVAPSDSKRIYASGVRSVDGVREGMLFVSRDDAESFRELPVPFDSGVEQGVYIAAVDPRDADTLYLRTSSATRGRLLVSKDAGASFSTVFSGSPVVAFALSPDGERLYFGGAAGVYAGSTSDLAFEQRSAIRCLCLTATDDTLYACSDEYSGFTLGASSDGGFTFEPKLHLKTVRGPLACDVDASGARCVDEWPSVRTLLGILPEASTGGGGAAGADGGAAGADGGAAGADGGAAGIDSGAETPTSPHVDGGGCTLPRQRPRLGFDAVLTLLLALFALSRRCR